MAERRAMYRSEEFAFDPEATTWGLPEWEMGEAAGVEGGAGAAPPPPPPPDFNFAYTRENVFDPIPQEAYGIPGMRDLLSGQRDALLQPGFAQYRQLANQQGFLAAEDDATLMNDPAFRAWWSTGQVPEGQARQPSPNQASDPLQDAYARLIEQGGRSDLSRQVGEYIAQLLGRGGRMDPAEEAMRFEQARGGIDRARRAQVSQAEAQLADRGLMSLPGQPQGVHASALGRIEESLAPIFADAVRDIYLNEYDAADRRLLSALGVGADLGESQTRSLLGALEGASGRQRMLADIALANLDRNMAWNRFLAEFGLERERVMEEISSGRIDDLMQMFQMWLQLTQSAQGGYI